jgi:hypothetical protein
MTPKGLLRGTDVAHHVDQPRQRHGRSFDFVWSRPGRVRFGISFGVIKWRSDVTGNISRFWRREFLGEWRGTDDLSNAGGSIGRCRNDVSGTQPAGVLG